MPDVIALEDSSTDHDVKRNLDGVSHSAEHVLEHEFNRGKKHPLSNEEQDTDSHKKIPRIEDENGEANKELSKTDVNGSVSPAAGEDGADNDDDEEEDGDFLDDDDGDEDEEYTDKSAEFVDRKDKSAAVDYKGKGKMVVESDDECDDDDDDDTDDGEDDFPDGSGDNGEDSDELEEDPLAEVDLDNILPSRTRRGGGALRSGVWISGDKGKANDG